MKNEDVGLIEADIDVLKSDCAIKFGDKVSALGICSRSGFIGAEYWEVGAFLMWQITERAGEQLSVDAAKDLWMELEKRKLIDSTWNDDHWSVMWNVMFRNRSLDEWD